MKTALITGASSGIGYELAKLFANNHINLLLVSRNEKKLLELRDEFMLNGIRVHVLVKDLALPQSAQEVFDFCKTHQIHIDYLINNAGFGDHGFFAESDWKKQEEMMNLNMVNLVHLTHLFLPGMIANKSGRIMNLASLAAFEPGPLMSIYYASKAFVLSFSEAISNELENTGVTVTALCPGPTQSGFWKAAGMESNKLIKDRKMPSSKDVALYGYNSLMSGKVIAIYGTRNKIMAAAIRFVPRFIIRKIVRYAQDVN